jgi:hypothetical protein
MHRSALGKNVDMSSIATRNEKVRAVGNMNVNARGDILNSNNEVITDATHRVKNTYSHSVKTGATNIPFGEHVPLMADPDELTPEEKELFKDDEDIQK